MTGAPIVELLPWDSDFFGYPVARLLPRRVDTAVLDKALAWCKQNNVRCLYYLAAADDPQSLRAAQVVGMQFVDVRLTLERPLTSYQTGFQTASFIRQAVPSDHTDLLALAPYLAQVSRFAADSRFGWDKAVRLFEEWLTKEAGVVYVIETDTGLAGCITCDKEQLDKGVIRLLIIRPDLSGQGLGKALCSAGLDWMAQLDCSTASVVTQGHNVSSQRVYQYSGFLTHSVEIWFHKWFDKNE